MVPILVLLTFAAFIFVEIALERRARIKEQVLAHESRELTMPFIPPRGAPGFLGHMVPGGVFLHPGHTWAHLQFSGEARVGIDEFARRVVGKVDGILLPAKGKSVRQGEKLLTVVKGKKKLDFVSPLDGVVSVINDYVALYPEKISEEPYQGGWILGIQPSELIHNINRLRVASEASAWLGKEFGRLSEFIDRNMAGPRDVGATARDGGLYLTGIVEKMDDELFQKLVRSFFNM